MIEPAPRQDPATLALRDQLDAFAAELRAELSPALCERIEAFSALRVEWAFAALCDDLFGVLAAPPAGSPWAPPAPRREPPPGHARVLQTWPARCCWRRKDGRCCGRTALFVAPSRGGYVCLAHTPRSEGGTDRRGGG